MSTMTKTEATGHLIDGLVRDRVGLYRSSAYFKTAVDTLAQLLPLWVDGMAAQAAEADRQHAADMLGRSTPPFRLNLSDLFTEEEQAEFLRSMTHE